MVYHAIYNIFFHPLSGFPGPVSWSLTRIPYFRRHIQGTLPFDIKALHEQHGDVIRVAPDQLSFSSPQAWKDIMGHHKGGLEFTKSAWFYNVSDQPANITNETARQHGLLRRQFAHGFSERSMREQEPLIQKYVDMLVDRVRDRAGQTIDLGQWYNFATFDIIGDLVFGEPFHCLESGEYNPWISHIFESGRLGTIMQALAFVPTLKSFLLRIMAPRSARKAHEAHTKATRAKMLRRLQAEQNRPDLIEGLISRQKELVGYDRSMPYLPD